MCKLTVGLATALGFGVAFVCPAAATGSSIDPEPREVIQATVDEVLAVLRRSDLSSEERRTAIEEIAYARFDFTTMSRLVLGHRWKRFSTPQKQEFLREFKLYLANNYGSRIDRYDQEQVELFDERQEPRGDVTVRTRILGGEFNGVIVDYRLRDRDGTWRVIDVVIEGISLVSNYRDQFKEVLSRGGPDHLLEQLRKKNADGSVATAPASDTP